MLSGKSTSFVKVRVTLPRLETSETCISVGLVVVFAEAASSKAFSRRSNRFAKCSPIDWFESIFDTVAKLEASSFSLD